MANSSGTNGPRPTSTTGRNRNSLRNKQSRGRERGYTAGRERATGLTGVRQPGLDMDIGAALKRSAEVKAGRKTSLSSTPLPLSLSRSSATGTSAIASAAQSIASLSGTLGTLSAAAQQGGGSMNYGGFGNRKWQSIVPDRYEKWVKRAAAKYDINPALIAAVGKVESGWSPDVNLTSSAGAAGPMQVMPFWQGAQPHNISNYRGNIFAGAYILARYLKNSPNRRIGLASYNAGPANYEAGLDYAKMVLDILKNMRKRNG